MNTIVSTDNLVIPMRAKHRATGEMGTVTAVEPTTSGTRVHVTWDAAETVELPSSLMVDHVQLDPPAVLVSYYDATLAKVNTRVSSAKVTRKAIAAELGISEATLRRKLTGKSMLTVRNIGALADVLGCRMSELVA